MSISDDRPLETSVDGQAWPLDSDPAQALVVNPLPKQAIQREPAIQERNWQLLERYLSNSFLRGMRRFAYRITRNFEDAEDVVSEALLKTAGAFHNLEQPTFPRVKKYLHTTIHHLAIDLLRRKKRELKHFPPANIPDGFDLPDGPDAFPSPDLPPQEVTYLQAEDRRLQAAFAAIPNAARGVALLRFLWGYDNEEIAQRLGIKMRTVTTHLTKARKILDEHLPSRGNSHDAE